MQNWESRCSDCCIGILVGQVNHRFAYDGSTGAYGAKLTFSRGCARRRVS